MNDTDKLSAEFQELLVTPLEIYDGERGMVILLKVRRKVDALIKKHNKLVHLYHRGSSKQASATALISRDKEIDHEPIRAVKDEYSPPKERSNNPADVVDFLIQLRYICDCVAPAVVWLETLTYRHHWCKDCNKPYLEKED